MKEITFNSKEEMIAYCKKIGENMSHWLGPRGWEKHLMEIIDYFYPKTPKECKNLRRLKEYRRDRAKFIVKTRLYFRIDEQRR